MIQVDKSYLLVRSGGPYDVSGGFSVVLEILRKRFKILEYFEKFDNHGKFWKITSYDFQCRRQFLTLRALNDDTKILTETDTENFFTIPNFPKPKPILFSETKFFRNRNRDFFSETLKDLAKVSKPRSFEPKCQSLTGIQFIFL